MATQLLIKSLGGNFRSATANCETITLSATGLNPNRKLGSYDVIALFGAGGMGERSIVRGDTVETAVVELALKREIDLEDGTALFVDSGRFNNCGMRTQTSAIQAAHIRDDHAPCQSVLRGLRV